MADPDTGVLSIPASWWQTWQYAAEIGTTRRAKALVEFAGRHSPLYRERWRGIPLERASLDDLPVVTKRELMSGFDDWLTDRSIRYEDVARFLLDRSNIGELFAGKYAIWKSSGSTGEPGVYLHDARALAIYDAMLAMELRSTNLATHYAWGLLAQGGRAALVAATGDHFASIASWQRACRGPARPNTRAFSVAEPLPELVAALNAFQPAYLASYATTLVMLANEQRAGRLEISPSCLWSGGEYLSRAAHAAIERAFGTVLVNEYGASECLSIAHSCRHGALHVDADWVILEPVDRNFVPTPPGERSHTVLLTNLANRIQPVIRYDLGDSVVSPLIPCECGSPLPAIEVEGRCDDVLCLRASDGTTVDLSPLALTTVVEAVTGGHRFQVVQQGPTEIDVRLAVRERRTRTAEWHAVEKALCSFLAQQSLSNVHVRLAPKAPAADPFSGKLREVLASANASSGGSDAASGAKTLRGRTGAAR